MRVAVVGAGIAGLAAAHELSQSPGVDVVVLEASERAGGKIATGEVAGCTIDLGPDAFLARRPEAVTLCDELGVGGNLVAPATGEAAVWSRGRLRALPPGLVLGIPTRPLALIRTGILGPYGTLRAVVEPWLPGRAAPDHDVAIGAVVRRRLGDEAHERLVDPLLGGINAGDTDRLSIDACAPQVAAAARRSPSLVRGARRVATGAAAGPVFLTPHGGLGSLVAALEGALTRRGVEMRHGWPADSLEPGGEGVRLTRGAETLDADAAVIAVPAFAAAPLLASAAPGVAATLAAVDYASVALVALAYRRSQIPELRGSGFLVPRVERRTLTACTFASTKWAHVGDDGTVIIRASVGRAGDDRALALDDPSLVAAVRADLSDTAGIDAGPVDTVVARWPRSFPQYEPGHLIRMGRAQEELRQAVPAVALAGAALGGVGIPACIGSGQAAARTLLERRAAGAGEAP